MKHSKATLAVFIAAAGVIASVIAFLCFSRGTSEPLAVEPPVSVEADAPVATNPEFEKSADRVTFGSGRVSEQTDAALIEFDRIVRRMAEMPDGEEKIQLAHQIEAITDRRAVPVLIDWAVAATDRAVLRSCLTALGNLGNGEMIADIEKRYGATRLYDERYRLAKVVRNITNPDAAPALMDLARSTTAPNELLVAATDALASVATPPAVSLLLQKLEGEQGDNSTRLATAIARIDREQALSTLQFAARGNKDASSVRTRVAAIQALANFNDDQTRELLTQLRTDTTEEVRSAATTSLNK